MFTLCCFLLEQTRKRSRCEPTERPDINGNISVDLEDSPAIPVEKITNLSIDNDFVSVIYFCKLYEKLFLGFYFYRVSISFNIINVYVCK